MLKSLNDALVGSNPQPQFDALAQSAREFLAANAIVIVDADILGRPVRARCDRAEGIDPAVLNLARAVPVTEIEAEGGSEHVASVPIDADAPFGRVLAVRLRLARTTYHCLIFPAGLTLDRELVRNFVAMAERRLAEVTLMRRYRDDLKRYVEMFNQLERAARIGLWDLDLAAREVRISDQIQRILEIPQRNSLSLDDALAFLGGDSRRHVLRAAIRAMKDGDTHTVAFPIVTGEGTKRAVQFGVQLQAGPDGSPRLAGVLQDVTEQHQATERLWWIANHDPLTELPNRALFSDRLAKALERRVRSGRIVCLLFVDVDKFKVINDTHGHAAGDALLQQVGQGLRANVRVYDTVARIGGDEFAILLDDVQDRAALNSVLARLGNAVELPFEYQSTRMTIALSVGAAIAPDHGDNETSLSAAADLALYRAKAVEGGRICLFENAFRHAAALRGKLLDDARDALALGHIVPYYQPQFDMERGVVTGVEALARWVDRDGERGPDTFAEAMADDQVGSQISRCIIDRALDDMARINRQRTDKLSLSVNVSASQLLKSDILNRLYQRRESMPDAGPVVLEVAEKALANDPEGRLTALMAEATTRGLAFALDDFGAGYASLVHLTNLPITELKVDRRFVEGVERDRQKAKLIEAIIAIAKSLGLRAVIEGVETKAQADAIAAAGGHSVQGFYYARPLAFEALVRALARTGANALHVA
ncbi:EAL domain-containing protein [Acuticoccus sp. MNP-M23]|uniref:putative bifunctional diguanylate cyclase/phosphodiesterase n=1 Tax=Acuticoccus sp. MNP-M23 TaxID=3072793 RepID=UPI002814C92A|nr:EAL domain-containing protein [Acuticoccus sp. MNP-M23]WMS41233.1 EAL domain-containing protein [Acuticoccus sp. MNP-M23]